MKKKQSQISLTSVAALALLAGCGGGTAEPTVQPVQTAPRLLAQVQTVAPSPAIAPGSPTPYTLLSQDNFDGTAIDTAAWTYRESPTIYAGGYNRHQNVSVSGGLLHIAFKKEDINGDGLANEYTGGGIISTHNFGYGYYEARVKLVGGVNGFHQSFWQMGLPYGDGSAPGLDALVTSGVLPYYNRTIEIDGFEQDSNNAGTISTTGHYYLPTHTYSKQLHSVDTTNWFVMGYEWLPGQVKFYINDVLVRTMPFDSLYGQSNVWLTALANNVYSGALGAVPAGTEMQVDYFRFYTSNLIGTNRITNGGFEYNSLTGMSDSYPMGWLEYADAGSSNVYKNATEAHTGGAMLSHSNATSNYTVTTKQNVENIPNGTYKLTAWIKSSGGQTSPLMRVLNHGGAEMNIPIPASAGWTQITIDNISVTTNKALIAFSSVALAGQWIKVDDVVFVQK